MAVSGDLAVTDSIGQHDVGSGDDVPGAIGMKDSCGEAAASIAIVIELHDGYRLAGD